MREVEVRDDYRTWLRFNDGAEGQIDLREHLTGPVLEALRDPAAFAVVQVDPEIRTIAWPNGAGFAPECLHGLLNSGVAAA